MKSLNCSPKTSLKASLKIILLLIAFSMLMMPVFSYTDPSDYVSSAWAYPQYSLQSTASDFDQVGGLFDPVGVSVYGSSYEVQHNVVTLSSGSSFPMLGYDADGDGTNELITFEGGNIIGVFGLEEGLLVTLDEYNLGCDIEAGMSYVGDYDSDGNYEFIAVCSTDAYILEFNGTDINLDNTINGLRGSKIITPVCAEISGLGETLCYIGISDTNSANVSIIDPTAGTLREFSIGDNNTFSYFYHNVTQPPLDDVDLDGHDEIVLPVQFLSNGFGGYILFDTYLNTSSSGVQATLQAGITRSTIAGIMVWNYNNVGVHEIWLTYDGGAANHCGAFIEGFTPSGSTVGAFVSLNPGVGCSPDTRISNPVLANIYNTSTPEICYAYIYTGAGAGNHRNNLECFDPSRAYVSGVNTLLYQVYENFSFGSDHHLYYGTKGSRIASADIEYSAITGTGDDGYHNILFGGVAASFVAPYYNFDNNETGFINYSDSAFYDNASVIVVDLNRDNVLEICGTDTGLTYCVVSDYNNSLPELNGRSFGQNYITPVCLGTTVTFTARECGFQPCHYKNDVPQDQERLISTCGTNSSYFNGTWSTNNPSIGCYYGTVGNYNFDIFLQDDVNNDDFSVYQSKSLFVINGTPGVDCNLAVTPEIAQGSNVTTVSVSDEVISEDEIQEAVEILTAQSDFVKNLLVLIFTIAFVVALVKLGLTNPFTMAILIFILWIIFAMIGLMSFIYVMIAAIVSFALAVAFVMTSTKSE